MLSRLRRFRRESTGTIPTRQLGREIFVLAGLAAIVPMLAIATVVFLSAESELRNQATTELQTHAERYGRDVRQRLSGAYDLLFWLGSGAAGPLEDIFRQLDAYAVIDRSGRTVAGALSLPTSLAAAIVNSDSGRLIIDSAAASPRLLLLRNVGEQVVVGELSAGFLWQDTATEQSGVACAFYGDTAVALNCSGSLSPAQLPALAAQLPSGEVISWTAQEQAWLAGSAAIVAPEALEMPPLYVAVGQPRDIVFGGTAALRNLYVPMLGLGLALALLGAFVYSRRILRPIARMVDVTRELTRRDVWGRADLRRQDQFSNVAYNLQHMADELAQHFNARETLSQIDQAILTGSDTSQIVQLVLQHIVESVQCRRAAITLLGPDGSAEAVTTVMSRGHPVTRTNDVELPKESRDWLRQHAEGRVHTARSKGTAGEPFVASDAPFTYVLPILVQGQPAAAVSIMATHEDIGADELQKIHVRDLAGRLAVALEVVTRSELLQRKAYFDDLTGLPNRDFCFERLDKAIKQAKNTDSFVAVMFIDLDGFKAINDSLGHIAGDELIRQAAYRLSDCVSNGGTIGRLGGDEFAVVLPYTENSLAPEALAERVLGEINKPFQIGSSEIQLSASVGVARYPQDGDTRVELLRKADTAMYNAKETGRGRKIDYSNTMGVKVDDRMRLEAELRHATENGELELYYQPQMDMRSGRITSAEALIRWNHPERGLVLPNDFVPIAEDCGYINVLGGWVMSTACRQLSVWKEQGLGLERVSVNVSAGQFRRTDFVHVVESSLFELQFASNALEIELTERVFVEDITQARKTLEMLKSLGVVVSIDDFGTGYSSLGYLKHLTFDAVKVDQSFVHELPGNRESEAIVRSVLAMCHTLDKQVVAEGIETSEQFNFLRSAGVDIGQGYRIGKPMNTEDFERYVMELKRNEGAAGSGRRLSA